MSISTRKFYRTVIQVEILSESPYDSPESLKQVDYDISEGHCSGDVTFVTLNEQVDGPAMAKLLLAQRSDPEFFSLTEDGEDIIEHEDEELREGDPCPTCGITLVNVTEEDGPHLKCPGCGLYWDAEDDDLGSMDSTGEPEPGDTNSTEEP
jgi:hypothetical protein